MYGFIWKKVLQGPTWLKIIEALVVSLLLVWVLFQWGFPWFVEVSGFGDTTVQ